MPTSTKSAKQKVQTNPAEPKASVEHIALPFINGMNAKELQEQITKMHLIEEELRRSVEDMANKEIELRGQNEALNNAAIVSEVDLQGNIIFVNDAFCHTSKYGRDELIGKKQSIVRHPDMPAELYDNLWATITKGKVWRGQIKNRAKDGSHYWVDVTITPVLDNSGKPIKYVGVRFVITEQKEQAEKIIQALEEAQQQKEAIAATEEELRQNMEEMTATQEEMMRKEMELRGQNEALNNAAVVSEVDLQGNIIFVNDEFCRLAKYTREELIGRKQSIIRHPDMPASLYDDLWSTITKGNVWKGQIKNRAKDGSHYWVDVSITPVIGPNGRPIKYIGVRFDITEQKQQEEDIRLALIEAQKQQEDMVLKEMELDGQNAALNNAAIVSEVDLQGNILFVNDEFCRLAKYTREELIGRKQSIVRHPDMPASVFEDLWSTITKGRVWKGEVKNRAKDGTHYWVDATITPVMGITGKPIKYVGVRFDITAQKEAEERMKGQLNAINYAYASIEFDKYGNILTANDIFLETMGYSLAQLQGKHHRVFNTVEYANSAEYQEFWEKLGRGTTMKGDYQRVNSQGQEVWLNGAYTPIKNDRGEVVRVIKLATNVTNFTIGFQASTKFIDELKRGNFDAKLDLKGLVLDGDIAKVTKDLEALSVTLKGVITEVNRVVNLAGREGQLRERLVLNGVQGAWKDLGDSLNSMLINVSEPILEINRIITALSMGDLTHRFDREANGDIKDMANALNIALENINKLMRNIEGNALTVASSSAQMLDKAESMKSTTMEVSSSISQMAEGAQEQAYRIDDSSKLVEGILKSANETGTKAEVINSAAERGQRSCQDGLKTIRKVVNNMLEITNSADITSSSIEVLTNRSEEISRTLRVITDIASQTNLLALNAAIEAARAGDAGRGFAVVAEEIRKLAEDSRKSAVDIEKVIKDVQKDTNSATKAIDKMKDSVVSGTNATKEAEETFESINTSSNDTLMLSKQVLEATKEQKNSIAVVVKNIEKIVVVSEETASGTHEIASSSQELSKSMTEVSDTGRSLSSVAKQLKDSIAQFKLS